MLRATFILSLCFLVIIHDKLSAGCLHRLNLKRYLADYCGEISVFLNHQELSSRTQMLYKTA